MKQNLNYLETFRKNINNCLLENGISQKELSEDLQLAPPVLNRYIRGERRIPEDLLSEIAKILNTTEAKLFGVNNLDEVQAIYSIPDGVWRNAGEGLELAASLQLENNPLMEVLKNVLTVNEIDSLYEYAHKTVEDSKNEENKLFLENMYNLKLRQRLLGYPPLHSNYETDWNSIFESLMASINSEALDMFSKKFEDLRNDFMEKQKTLEEQMKKLENKLSEKAGTQNDC